MMNLSLAAIEKAVSGRLNHPDFGGVTVSQVSTDSRQDLRGKLFLPFEGAQFDGHDFIAAAFEKGAACCLSERETLVSAHPLIYVKSVKYAVMNLAEYYRSLFDVEVVGVTGSVGKTTTKDLIASVLAQQFQTLKTEGNQNNELGLPLTILQMEDNTQKAVIEMGMSNFGEIHNLSKIARPSIGVITNIGVSHIENLGSREGILKAKTEMFDFMPPDGYVVLNGDDALLAGLAGSRKNILFYGTNSDNDFYATDIQYNGIKGVSFTIHEKATGHAYRVEVPVPGFHMVQNALCAAAVGRIFGLELDLIRRGIETFHPSYMRMDIFENVKGASIINDVYNSSPDAARAALGVLRHAQGRKICVLGDMLELGKYAQKLHYELGEYAATIGIDYLLCFGTMSEAICEGARAKALEIGANPQIFYFTDKKALTARLASLLQKGDTALVKASRGMKFEEIVAGAR